MQEPSGPERNGSGPLLCCWGSSAPSTAACRRVIPGCKHDSPTQTLRQTPHPPAKHSMKRGERPAFPRGSANHKQGHVHAVHGEPFILPVTQLQLRWGGGSSCERPHSSMLSVRVGWQVGPQVGKRPGVPDRKQPPHSPPQERALLADSQIASTHICQAQDGVLEKSVP